MTGWMVFLLVLFIFFLIGMIRASFIIEYEEEFFLTLKVLFFKIRLVPGKEKKIDLKKYSRKSLAKQEEAKLKKDKKSFEKKIKKKKDKIQAKRQVEQTGEKKKKMSFSDVKELVAMILKAVSQLFSHLFGYIRTDVDRMHIYLSGGSPDKTAIMYGGCMGGVNLLFEFLDKKSHLKFKSKDSVLILPDYVEEGFKASVKLTIKIRVWQVFGMILPSGITAVKYFVKKAMKKNPDEKKNETVSENKNAKAQPAE